MLCFKPIRRLATVASAIALAAGLSIPAATAASAQTANAPVGPFLIQDIGAPSLCLDVNYYQQYAGASVILWTCRTSDPLQQWADLNVNPGGSSVYQLQSVGAPGLCLDVNYYQQYAGASVILWTCQTSDPLQQWSLQPTSIFENWKNMGAGTCLDVNNDQQYAGASAIQQTCKTDDNLQLWQMVPA